MELEVISKGSWSDKGVVYLCRKSANPLSPQYFFDIAGTLAFAISGALAVQTEDHDLFSAMFTSFLTALGGGTLRDLLLGVHPLVWIGDVTFIYITVAGALLAFVFYHQLKKLQRTLVLFDSLGISFFTLVGVEKALSLNFRPEVAIIMGVFSAVMGGVIRDTMTNVTPIIFKRTLYASACLIGGLLYVILDKIGLDRTLNFTISFLVIFGLRQLSLKYHLGLPAFNRYQK